MTQLEPLEPLSERPKASKVRLEVIRRRLAVFWLLHAQPDVDEFKKVLKTALQTLKNTRKSRV